MSHRKGPKFCPTINADRDGASVFVRPNINSSISFRVNIIAQFIVENPLIWQFKFKGRSFNASGRLLGDSVYCDATNFGVAFNQTVVLGRLDVKIFWDGWKALENPDNLRGTIEYEQIGG